MLAHRTTFFRWVHTQMPLAFVCVKLIAIGILANAYIVPSGQHNWLECVWKYSLVNLLQIWVSFFLYIWFYLIFVLLLQTFELRCKYLTDSVSQTEMSTKTHNKLQLRCKLWQHIKVNFRLFFFCKCLATLQFLLYAWRFLDLKTSCIPFEMLWKAL